MLQAFKLSPLHCIEAIIFQVTIHDFYTSAIFFFSNCQWCQRSSNCTMECLSGEQFSWWAQIIVMQSPEIFITKGHINYYFPWKLISFYIPPHSGNLMIYVCTKGDHLKKIHKRWSSKIFVWTKGDLMLFWTCGFRLCSSGLGSAPGHLQFNMSETNLIKHKTAKHRKQISTMSKT